MQEVILKPHIFDDREAIKFDLVEGATINDFIKDAKLPTVLNKHIRASINGIPATVEEFSVPLKIDDKISIYVVPMGGDDGGKSILRIVAMIAIVAVAPLAISAYAGLTTTAFTYGGYVAATMAFTAVGMLAVNALIPPPTLNTGVDGGSMGASASTLYTVTGQSNAMSPYGIIPRLYGTHLFYPLLCTQPLVWNSGKSSYMTAVYDFGFAEIEQSDMRIGTTSIDNYEITTNFLPVTKGDDLTLYTQRVDIQNTAIELKKGAETVRETALETNIAEIEISLPRGLVNINDRGDYTATTVDLKIIYRKAGSSDVWSSANIINVGAGIKHDIPSDTLDIFMQKSTANGWNNPTNNYYIPTTTDLIINAHRPIKKGEVISNILNGGIKIGETRTVIEDAPAGKDIAIRINKPFTNFVRNERGDEAKYFPTSFGVKNDVMSISNNTVDPYVVTAKIEFDTLDKYEIKIVRLTDDAVDRVYSTTTWQLLRSFQDDTVMELDHDHTVLELSLKANEQINGVVENLNAICMSKLKVYTHQDRYTIEKSNNPAWVVYDILTGSANAGAIKENQIDLTTFLNFSYYCDELVTVLTSTGEEFQQKRHTCNIVVKGETTVNDLVMSVLSQARASLKLTANGRYGILIDQKKDLPNQMFTNRNSSGFSSERNYADMPHALRVKYINPLKGYEIDEVIVYADGYDKINAEKFEDLETFGITDYYEAYRHGRYTLAQIIAYQEKFTIDVDLEYLSVLRGDLVSVQNDVAEIGGLPVRVKEVLNGGLNIIVNDVIPYDDTKEYHYLVRADGINILQGAIADVVNETEIVLAVANPLIKAGDLFVYGFKDQVTKDYIVNYIMPSGDLKAKLTLSPYDPAVYTADTGRMPVYESGIAPEIGNECRVKIEDLKTDYRLSFDNRLPVPTFNISWNVTSVAPLKHYRIEWGSNSINGLDFTTDGYTNDTEYILKLPNLKDNPRLNGVDVVVKITPISLNDEPCIATYGDIVKIAPDEVAPIDVEFFNVNIVSETLNLTWRASEDIDIDYYIIKFNASIDPVSATWERSTVLTDKISYDTLRHTTNARSGTYLIKAIDTSGNMSVNATRVITQIPNIINLNFVELIQDAPSWDGQKNSLINESGELQTASATAEPTCSCTVCDGVWRDAKPWCDTIAWDDTPFDYRGTIFKQSGSYTFENMLDLGDIYTPRISTDIDAYSSKAEEIMYNWVKLSDVSALAFARYDLWSAQIMVKMASKLSSIATWDKLSDVVLMSDGLAGDWTDASLVEMGDFTGRYFRFYLEIQSQSDTVRVNITDAQITVDMPDRVISENDIISAVGVNRVEFIPAFFVVPALAIAMDNANKGDRYIVSNKNESGFDIEFLDTNDVSISSQFDFMAKGYGSKTDKIIQRS